MTIKTSGLPVVDGPLRGLGLAGKRKKMYSTKSLGLECLNVVSANDKRTYWNYLMHAICEQLLQFVIL